MTLPDSGVDLLLRRATADLRPDVDQLVAAGITRGRSKRRRAQIGTAVATVVVFGVIGAGAAVVPQLGGGPDSARDPVQPATSSPSPTETPPPVAVLPPLTVAAADIPAVVDELLGTRLASAALLEAPFGVTDEPRRKTVHFRYDGMLTTIVFEPAPPAPTTCEVATDCEVDSGPSLTATFPTTLDGVTSQGVEAIRYGYAISARSYNAALGKDSPPLASEPPLSLDQLTVIAGSDTWFG